MSQSKPEFKHVEVRRTGAVVTCALSNPPRHTLTALGVQELVQLMDWIEDQSDVRVVVFTGGAQGVFIAHYEVGELAAGAERNVSDGASSGRSGSNANASIDGPGPADAADPASRLHELHRLILRLEASEFITIAAINGNAAGGGLELALGCDLRLMADGPFRVGLPETSVGIIPGAGGTQRFARLLGTARALDLILHAHLMSPREAHELGLVHRVYPVDEFEASARAFASQLAARAPIAMAAAKRAIQYGSRESLTRGLLIEQECFERTMRSKDAARAMRAMLSGESWEWRGE